MRIFNLDKTYNVVCNTEGTRNGFRHTATLCGNGYERIKTTINYLNRTWERFTYEDVLIKIVSSFFEGKEKDKYLSIISKWN